MPFIIALGLDRPCLAILVLEDQINATVSPPSVRPLIPQPRFVYLGFPIRIIEQEPLAENFKVLSVITFLTDFRNKVGE